MKNTNRLWIIPTIFIITLIGFSIVACDNGNSPAPNQDPKVLKISNLSTPGINFSNYTAVGLVEAGTPYDKVMSEFEKYANGSITSNSPVQAYSISSKDTYSYSGGTAAYPLYNPVNDARYNGTGYYYVWLFVFDDGTFSSPSAIYKSSGYYKFDLVTTTIDASIFSAASPSDDGKGDDLPPVSPPSAGSSFAGDWKTSLYIPEKGNNATIYLTILAEGYWFIASQDIDGYFAGTYSTVGSTATMKFWDNSVFCKGTRSGNTLTIIILNEGTSVSDQPIPFTKDTKAPNSNLKGGWTGTLPIPSEDNPKINVYITGYGWYMSIPSLNMYEAGPCTLTGNTGTFSNNEEKTVATVTLSGNNSATVTVKNAGDGPMSEDVSYTITRGGAGPWGPLGPGNSNGGTAGGDLPDKNSNGSKLEIELSADAFAFGDRGFKIGVFPVEISEAQALEFTGIIAGVDNNSPGWYWSPITGTDPVILTVPLYDDYSTGSPSPKFVPNGTYIVFARLYGDSENYYKAPLVIVSNYTTTYISWSSVEILPLP